MSKPKVGLIGGGSWATALAKLLCENHESIDWWVRNEEIKNFILKHKHNPNYLRAVEFDTEKLNLTTDINQVVENSDWIVLAVPRSEEHTSELQSRGHLVCRLLLEKKNK